MATETQAHQRELSELFEFEPLETGMLRARPGRANPYGMLFGGQLIGQSIAAAQVHGDGRSLHSLHLNFIKPGNAQDPIDFAVERLRDGRSFSTRLVRAVQGTVPLATATASFRTGGDGFHHQRPATETGDPEAAMDIIEASALVEDEPGPFTIFVARPCPVELRIPSLDRFYRTSDEARRNYWIRVRPPLPDLTAEDHKVLFGYISDLMLAGVAMVPHLLPMPGPHLRSVSLDHAIWFHAPVDCSRWVLFETECSIAANGCNLTRAHAYDENGTLIASIAQEVLQSAAP